MCRSIEETIARGRELVESDAQPLDMVDQLAMVDYFGSQREIVRRRGCCGHTEEQWITPMGRCVCKHTRNPCPRQALALLVEVFSILNRGGNDGERIGRTRRRGNRTGR